MVRISVSRHKFCCGVEMEFRWKFVFNGDELDYAQVFVNDDYQRNVNVDEIPRDVCEEVHDQLTSMAYDVKVS